MATGIDPSVLGRIHRLDARDVWKHEALQFTPWLEEHIDELNEAIGLEIELSGREEGVGPFAVDLYGREVQTGHPAIIENQLENTDHSHLGQLLTYAAGLKAGVVVWIAPRFRDEHLEALNWLNEISSEDVNFFAVEIEVLEIRGQYAPNFRLVAQPNAWQKSRSAMRGGGATHATERMLAYQTYFASLLQALRQNAPHITTASKTQPQSWFQFSSGVSGVHFGWSFTRGNRFRVELNIDTGNGERNKALFDSLKAQQQGIEEEIGSPLLWEWVEGRRYASVFTNWDHQASIANSAEELDAVRQWAVPTMMKFVGAFRPRLKALRLA
jgi:hypothetical protein